MKESFEKRRIFSDEEQKLLKKYVDEYNDIYEKIFNLSQIEFIINLRKRVKISLKDKINLFSQITINKIENYFNEHYYFPDLKISLIAKKHILKQNNKENEKNFFDGEIIPHCDKDKYNNYYLHSCGQRFHFFRYKLSNKNIENENNNNVFFRKIYDYFLYCVKCDKIYKSSMIKLKCFHTGKIFYSKLMSNNDCYKDICYATWKKYHCNAIINDTIKCQKCKNSFIYNKEKNILICQNCKFEINASKIKFLCLICKKEFTSEVKIYNPLEYKLLKISIKDALINEELAFPKYMGCQCSLDINSTKFFHKSTCNGVLYLGEFNYQKIVVCAKCDSMNVYEEFVWTCPKCLKRFKSNKNNNNDNDEEKNNKINLANSLNIEQKSNNFKSEKYTKIKKNRQNFINFDKNRYSTLRNSSLNKKNDLKIKTKIKSINKDYFDEINNLHSSRIRVKKRVINNLKTRIESSQEKSRSINNSSTLKDKSQLNKNFKKKIKVFLTNSQSSAKDNNISLLKQKIIFRRPTNFLTNLSSRENSIKHLVKTSRDKDSILCSDNIDVSQSLNYKTDFNKIIYNSKKPINNKEFFKGRFIEDYRSKKHSINIESEKRHSENIITKYIKIKKKSPKISINNVLYNNKDKENGEKKKIGVDDINETRNKATNFIKFQGDFIRNVNNLKNGISNCILTPKEFTRINIVENYSDKKNYNNSNNNIYKYNDNNYDSINLNDTGEKKHQSKIYQEKNIMNKCLNSNSTAYESEQNSKLNSLKLCQLIYNNNNLVHNEEYNNISDYKIIKQIGKGTFGHIFMVENEKKEFFALKKLIACSLKEIQILEHEYQILFELNSSEEKIDLVSILKIETKQLDPTTFVMYVLMELSNTDWEKEILNRQKTFNFYTENQLLSIMSSLIKTFAFLQKKNISHRDIKPQNILVFNDNKYKLADFGEAKELIDNSKVTEKRTLRGTELYMSPILFNALRSRKPMKYVKHNTYKSDVFSFGLCLIFAGSLCFDILYDIRELKNIEDIKKVFDIYLGKRYSKKFINFIYKMVDVNEDTRYDFIELEQKFNSMII